MSNPRSRKPRNGGARFIEPLEGRVLFATTPADVNLGLVGAAAVGASGSVSLVKNSGVVTGTVNDALALSAASVPAPDIEVRYNGTPVVDGDVSPDVADGTDFGSVGFRQPPVDHTFTITNTGGATLELSAAELVQFPSFDLLDGFPSSIAPGASAPFTVRLLTSAAGLRTERVIFTTNVLGKETFDFSIQGFVVAGATENLGTLGAVAVSDSGTVRVDIATDTNGNHFSDPQPRTLRFRLASAGNITLRPTATWAEDTDVRGNLRVLLARDANGNGLLDQAEYNSPLLDRVAVSGSGQQTFTREDLPAGDYFVGLSVTDFSQTSGAGRADVDYEIALTAQNAGAADVAVSFSGAAVADGDASPSAGEGTDFGAAARNAAGPQRTFTVTNTGSATLTLGAVNVSGGAFEVVSGLPATLPAGASASFVVALLTTEAGAKSGEVSFATNAAGKDPYNFAVTGSVTEGTGPGPGPTPGGAGVSVDAVDARIPSFVVGGEKKATGKATIRLTNTTADRLAAPFTVSVYASADGVVSEGSDLPIGSLTKTLKFKPGAARAVKVRLKIGAPPADGDYRVLAAISGGGHSAAGEAAATVRIERPVVRLEGVPDAPPAASLSFGRGARFLVPLVNRGNVAARGRVDVELFVSTDGSLDPARSFPLTTVGRLKTSLNPAATKPLRLKFTLPQAFPAPHGPGSYFLVARLTALDTLGLLNAANGATVAVIPFTIGL